jgi:hypothetical protein
VVGKCCGIGIILSTGFVHMLQPGAVSLTDPSLPTAFSADYTAYGYLFALLGIYHPSFLIIK